MTPSEWMRAILAVIALAVLVSFWRAHRSSMMQFNAFDLVMVGGKVDRIALCFMVAFAVTTWIVAYLTIRDRMTEGYLTSYGLMWVAPLVAKIVFNKNEVPSSTSSTTVVQQTTEVTK